MAPLVHGGEMGYLRIATEEAFAPREMIGAWTALLDEGIDDPGFEAFFGFMLRSDAPRPTFVRDRLPDLDEARLADMDVTGIDRQILSISAPGPNPFDADRGSGLATLANDVVIEACRRHPDRFSALATIAPQAPTAAAAELDRCKALGFAGALIDSHVERRDDAAAVRGRMGGGNDDDDDAAAGMATMTRRIILTGRGSARGQDNR